MHLFLFQLSCSHYLCVVVKPFVILTKTLLMALKIYIFKKYMFSRFYTWNTYLASFFFAIIRIFGFSR
ncbi:hypothetical protein CJJ18_00775 [Candidatus Williamhamiltonella defendens]|uniref:Uncharacterized protein n=1 Tax=Candidatus Williamhamiltonella defendens TaxID=138072 RepID=A0A2D3TB86_9ENTR|nr:hypothetical protein CJJ18_00775 [Candidatus Hamiltonella defensa]ATW33045.1 hypothetical protein BJP43_00765 [Candidatus Hamiltonella defensa]AWK15863.1 hypothetical protein CCS40_00775 [Candidatus Hamiltonella defensa]